MGSCEWLRSIAWNIWWCIFKMLENSDIACTKTWEWYIWEQLWLTWSKDLLGSLGLTHGLSWLACRYGWFFANLRSSSSSQISNLCICLSRMSCWRSHLCSLSALCLTLWLALYDFNAFPGSTLKLFSQKKAALLHSHPGIALFASLSRLGPWHEKRMALETGFSSPICMPL